MERMKKITTEEKTWKEGYDSHITNAYRLHLKHVNRTILIKNKQHERKRRKRN